MREFPSTVWIIGLGGCFEGSTKCIVELPGEDLVSTAVYHDYMRRDGVPFADTIQKKGVWKYF